jgi:hypothetical protein
MRGRKKWERFALYFIRPRSGWASYMAIQVALDTKGGRYARSQRARWP